MKLMDFKSWLVSALLLSSSSIYALNPVNGWYGGIFLAVSYAPSNTFTFQPPITFISPNVTLSADSGKLSRSVLGGAGGQIGYRFCDNFRLEGELMYNNNPFSNLKFQNLNITNTYNPAANVTNGSITYNNVEHSANAHIQGDVNTGAFMLNAYYDLFTPTNDGYSVVVPYVGIGVGYAYVQNALQFYRAQTSSTDTTVNREIFEALQTHSAPAGQGIVGLSYFLDDFTWFSADVRYWTTASLSSSKPSTQYTYISPTEVVKVSDSSVNLFGDRTQLVSVNITFNGVFDLG